MNDQQQGQHQYRRDLKQLAGEEERFNNRRRSKSVDTTSPRHNSYQSSPSSFSSSNNRHRRNHHLIINQNNNAASGSINKTTKPLTAIITPPKPPMNVSRTHNNKKKTKKGASAGGGRSSRHVSIDEIYQKINEVQSQLHVLRCSGEENSPASTATTTAITPQSQLSYASEGISPLSQSQLFLVSTPQKKSLSGIGKGTNEFKTPASPSATASSSPFDEERHPPTPSSSIMSSLSNMSIHDRTKLHLQRKEKHLKEIEKEMMANCTFKPITNHSMTKKRKEQHTRTRKETRHQHKPPKPTRMNQVNHQRRKVKANIKFSNKGTITPVTDSGVVSSIRFRESCSNLRPVTDRVEALMRKKRLEEEEIKQHCTFKPNMDWSRKSPPIMDNATSTDEAYINTSPLSRSTKENHHSDFDNAYFKEKINRMTSTLKEAPKKKDISATILKNTSVIKKNNVAKKSHQHNVDISDLTSFFNTGREESTFNVIKMSTQDYCSIDALTFGSNDDLPPVDVITTTISTTNGSNSPQDMRDFTASQNFNSGDTFTNSDFSPSFSSTSSTSMILTQFYSNPKKQSTIGNDDTFVVPANKVVDEKEKQAVGGFNGFANTDEDGFVVTKQLKNEHDDTESTKGNVHCSKIDKEGKQCFPLLSKELLKEHQRHQANDAKKLSSSDDNNDNIKKSLESSFEKEASLSPFKNYRNEYGSI